MTPDRKLDREKELIARAKLNHKDFAPLYEIYFEQVFRFVYSRVRDKDLTADLCSQTFMKAMISIRKYEFRGFPLSTWLFRIALNEVNMHFRKATKNSEVELNEKDLSNLQQEVYEAPSSEPLEILIEGLNLLDVQSVDLIEMRFFEKRRYAEIGEILGITEDNAKVRVYRAIKKLKSVMGGER